MFIDLHCHTKMAKSGDIGREVTNTLFKAKMEEKNVKLVAITNHNLFDLNQYNQFVSENPNILILPGVELDVIGNKSGVLTRGHVIVISDNNKVNDFNSFVKEICNVSPDDFHITIDDLVNKLKSLERCIVSFHYKKDPNLSIEDIHFFENNAVNCTVVLEPSNSRKAGIIINFENENSWFGSDNHAWNEYPGKNKELPDCLFNINSFDSLFHLLSKNQNAVLLKTMMNPKGPKEYPIQPFDDLNFDFPIYNDTNIVFGSKATGKTQILKAIEKALIQDGKNIDKFYIEEKSDDIKNLINYAPSSEDISIFDSHNCSKEFEIIKTFSWRKLPTLKDYLNYEKSVDTCTLIKKLKIASATFTEPLIDTELIVKKNNLENVKKDIKKVIDLKKIGLSEDEKVQLNELLNKLVNNYIDDYLLELFKFESLRLEKMTINYFSKAISDSQSVMQKPNSCGLITVFEDSTKISYALSKIMIESDFEIMLPSKELGKLQSKGMVYKNINLGYKNQSKSSKLPNDSHKYLTAGATKKSFDEFIGYVKKMINPKITMSDFNSYLSKIQTLITDGIRDLKYFLNYSIKLSCGGNTDFKPSNGESSIILVDSILHNDNLDAIILDEPDSGMGADYINDVLITDIKECAKKNKIVIISTHDPNLVVRTHPYMCIYRDNETDTYKTYMGSSFEDNMINIKNKDDKVSWIDKCISKCEGGNEAIIERERTYGHY